MEKPFISFDKNPHVNARNVAISKARVYGETCSTEEFKLALQHEMFAGPDRLIAAHTEHHYGLIKAVYKCLGCDCIHILCCDAESSNGKIKVGIRTIAECSQIKYADHLKAKGRFVSRDEMISILSKIRNPKVVLIEHVNDIDKVYNMTEVWKCPNENCNAPHLGCEYDQNSMHHN